MELCDFVPLLTASGALRELRLRDAGIDVLESVRHASRKVILVAVLQETSEKDAANDASARGVYITPKSVNDTDHDASVLLITLRFVDLEIEPFWGSLLLVVASHLFVAASGALAPSRFQQLRFLSDFLQWRVVERPSDSSQDGDDAQNQNTALLKDVMPRFTWVAVDLKIKDMEGLETPTKYFEYKLSNPPLHGITTEEAEAMMFAADLLPATARDCLSIKSTTLLTPSGFTAPQVFTSSKILSHALETITPKALFGRYMSGGVLLHLLRSLSHSITSQSTIVLQRVVSNVQLNYWKLLLESALEKYSDEIHARLSVYEKVEFDAAYLVDITERKMQSEHVSVVDAGQGQFSTFDEFGNLKRSTAQSQSNQNLLKSTGSSDDHGGEPPLNTSIFTFLKNRAERAFSKQFSTQLSTSSSNVSASSSSAGGGGVLHHILEDEATDGQELHATAAPVVLETPEDLLHKYNARIVNYKVPMQYINTPLEAMPVGEDTLERVHQTALDEAMRVVLPFLYDLRCTTSTSTLGLSLDLAVGKHNLMRRVRAIRQRFALANEAASALFCSQLMQYLHSVVLKKTQSENQVQQQNMPRVTRSTSTLILPDTTNGGKHAAAPLTKLPLELLTYKSNLEALVSQYHFVARGPMASRVQIGFFQCVVRPRLLRLAQKEYTRFAEACDAKENKLADLEDALENTQQLVQRHQAANNASVMEEAQSVAEIQNQHKDEIAGLQNAIHECNANIERALLDQRTLYQKTMQATRKTINTIDQVAVKNRVFMGYLERFEKGHLFSKSWRQYFYVLDHATLKCYKSKGAYEERSAPCEPTITLTGFNVVKSRTDESKIKLVPPENGQMLRFRAPASVGRETWMKKFIEAAQVGR